MAEWIGWCAPFLVSLLQIYQIEMIKCATCAIVHGNGWFVLHHLIGCKRFKWEKKKRVYTFKFGSIEKQTPIDQQANVVSLVLEHHRMIHFVLETSNGCRFAICILDGTRATWNSHTIILTAHNSDGAEKDTHISSQQLFSWVINRVRCAPCKYFVTSSESERWQWSIKVEKKTTSKRVIEQTRECEYHFQVSYSSNWMPIHDLFDRATESCHGIFHKYLLFIRFEIPQWKQTPKKRDKTPNRAQSKNDEVSFLMFRFCFVLFHFALFSGYKEAHFYPFIWAVIVFQQWRRKTKKQVSLNWKWTKCSLSSSFLFIGAGRA